MLGKVCVKCKEFKTFEMYSKRKAMKDGHRSECKECSLLRNQVYYSDPDIKAREAKRQREDYKDKRDARWKIYYENNRDKMILKARLRQDLIEKVTPSWADKEKIKNIYRSAKNLGTDYHVDHIIPLNSDVVCGLHVENNLQIISAKENLRKSNKLAYVAKGDFS